MNGLKKFGVDFCKCLKYTYDANPEMTIIVAAFAVTIILSAIGV